MGGCVRDFLLGRAVKDYDIATSASPDEICSLFPDAVTVGKAFGVLKVPVRGAQQLLEIATFREDLDYRDHRHPRSVRFAGPVEDARRRDFTINALYFDPKTSRILDSVGAVEDLGHQIIRAIGDPSERFREDALRLLRAVRFTTRLDFSLDPATAEAIRARAKLVSKVSAERVRDELNLMWAGPRPADSLEMLSSLGLLEQILPEVQALRHSSEAWKQLLRAVEILARQNPQRGAALVWAAILLHAARHAAAPGKRPSGKGPETPLAERVGTRLRLPRAEIDCVNQLLEEHLRFREVFKMRESTLQRFIREPHFEALLALHRAEATATDGNLAFYEFCASRLDQLRQSSLLGAPKLLDGKDLIQLGFKPGPEFTEILRTVEDLALERQIHTKEEALEYVVKHFVR